MAGISEVAKLFRQEAKFIAGAAKPSQIPNFGLPEVAFVGKSNVGKSSLINSVCNRRTLARVSHTPGRTQQINFFSLAGKLVIADLPGYGFAKVPAAIKQQWEKLITYYLSSRESLKLINLLIDARRGIKEHDIEVAKLLISYGKVFQFVFTKVDKVNSYEEIKRSTENALENLAHSCNVIYTSSRSREGARELQYSISQSIKHQ